jgi:hypothetical protein
MTSVADQFESKIEHGELPTPIPRWRVQFKYAVLWIVFAAFVIMGVMSSGVALWFISDPGGLLFEYKNSDALSKILDILPIFWILLSLAMTVAAAAVFAHAPRGYKYTTVVIGGSVLLAFVALGGAISAMGLSDDIEEAASYVPGYEVFQRPRINRIIRIEQNGLIGQIQEMRNGQIILRDPHGIIWMVDVSKCDQMNPDMAKEHNCVRAFGIPSTTINTFQAERIMPCPRGIRIQHIQMLNEGAVKEFSR